MDGVFENNVLEVSATVGTVAFALAAVPGFRRFREALTVGKPCHYVIKAVDIVGRPTGDYETGFGVYSAADTLTRSIVVESSNANALVNFAAGTKTVAMTTLAPNSTRAREDWQSALQLNFAGTVAYSAATVPPAGWLKCNGAQVSRTTYARLFAAIGTQFGAGDGANTFAVPDLRGEFIRSWDDGRTLDNGRGFGTVQGSQNLSHAHGVADPGHAHGVADPGHAHSAWTGEAGNHAHNYTAPQTSGTGTGSAGFFGRLVDGDVGRGTDAQGTHTHGVGVAAAGTGIWIYGAGTGIGIYADGGAEARPRNVSMLAVIKF